MKVSEKAGLEEEERWLGAGFGPGGAAVDGEVGRSRGSAADKGIEYW